MVLSPAAARHLITLRFTRPGRFHFLHGGAVNGLLCNALGMHPLPEGVVPFAPESGRVRFEPGDPYAIGITLVGEAREVLGQLLEGLARLGANQPNRDQPLPTFGGNFEVAGAVEHPLPDPAGELAAVVGATELSLRFVSPLRMTRPAAQRVPGANYLNAECFPVPHFLSRLWGRLFRLEHGREATNPERAALRPPLPTGAQAQASGLLWLDLPVPGKGDKAPERPDGITLGGVVGSVTLTGLPEQWLPLLLLGRHLHAGESTRFGLGRYRIDAPGVAPDPFVPARSLLAAAADPAALGVALERVVTHSEAAGVDGMTPAEAAARRDELVAGVAGALSDRAYLPERLLGVLLPKEGGKVRPLAVPTIRDRVVQRAACDVLAPALDTLLEDSSYAYRKGLSRAAAAVAIERAHDEGFRWVLDADIESFFDCVDHERLFAKLDALYPDEPLVPLIKRWVAAPVEFQGRLIERRRGLPQGAVVSPLLANLYLDELDEELLTQGFRLVRYADDFVVLCRDLDAARAAQQAVQAGLAKLGLQLNVDKTDIRTFSAGFRYLGYLFCRSLVLDGGKRGGEAGDEPLATDAVPPASWLAEVPFDNVRDALTHRRVQQHRKRRGPAPRPLAAVAPVLRPLYITDPATELVLRHEKLVITSPTAGMREVGIRTISHAVFVGRVRSTMPVVLALSRLGVPCFFVRRTGSLYAEVGPHAPSWPLWQAQGAKAADPAARLEFARAVVLAKLHNTATIAVRHKLQGSGELGGELRELERRCLEQTDADALRGFEGRGAACFFGALKATLPGEWGFEGRRRSPPPDPVNAMLSFAYTILYNHISTALHAAGLHPRIGLFHAERGAYHALACDLQEEFRHLAESHVISIIHRRELKPDDFVASSDGRYPSLLSAEARREFLHGFERRLLTEFTPPETEEKLSYLAFIDRQAQQLKMFVEGRAPAYEPLRIHA